MCQRAADKEGIDRRATASDTGCFLSNDGGMRRVAIGVQAASWRRTGLSGLLIPPHFDDDDRVGEGLAAEVSPSQATRSNGEPRFANPSAHLTPAGQGLCPLRGYPQPSVAPLRAGRAIPSRVSPLRAQGTAPWPVASRPRCGGLTDEGDHHDYRKIREPG